MSGIRQKIYPKDIELRSAPLGFGYLVWTTKLKRKTMIGSAFSSL
jgi:hypothetical protein